MAIDLSNYGDYFKFVRNFQSIPPLFSIAVWVNPSATVFAQTAYGGFCFSRDVNAVGLLLSGASGVKPVFDWSGGNFNRDTGLNLVTGQWQLVAGTCNANSETTYLGNRTTGAFGKDVNSEALSSKGMQTWFVGVDDYDHGRRIDGLYAMVAMEQACWTESEVRRMFRGEPMEDIRPRAFLIQRNMEYWTADDEKTVLTAGQPRVVKPSPPFLQKPTRKPFWFEVIVGGGGGNVFNDTITESIALGDAYAALATLNPSASEALTLTATHDASVLFGASVTEGITPGDNVAQQLAFGPVLLESIALGDQHDADATAAFSPSDTEGLTLGDAYDSPAPGGATGDWQERARRRGVR
jgi:hypothetical protein